MSKPRVAMIGLGIMGSGMAGRLLSANFPLSVYNRNRDKSAPFAGAGATVAASPREAAVKADIIISMVADDVASRGIWLGENGALAGVSRGAALIECSTLTVGWIKELATAAAQHGCELLDAPVTGTKPHAASGELSFLMGGSQAALATAQPVLSVLGREFIHLGPTGSGALMKLINNFMCGVQAASLAEAEYMIGAGGLDLKKALSILTPGAPGSGLCRGRRPAPLPTISLRTFRCI
jgi:3-hydroxyisobutyrate dehydrogenase